VRLIGMVMGRLALALVVAAAAAGGASAQIQVTDLAGRSVSLERPASRMVIDDGRFLTALAMIHPDPSTFLAAWPHDTSRIGSQAWQGLRSRFPGLASLPTVPSSAAPFSVE